MESLEGSGVSEVKGSTWNMGWAERDKRVLWHPFTSMREWVEGTPLVIAGAHGNYLVDSDGRRYFDGVSSLWVTVHGHGHARIVAAIGRQAAELDHSTMLGLTHPKAIELAERLVAIAPAGLTRVFYSDSGSTAVEIALKQAFQYWAHRGRPGKQRFLHVADAYHGDTLGAVGVGGISLFHRVFGPLIVQGLAVPSPATVRCGSTESAGARTIRAGVREEEAVTAQALAEALAAVDEVLAKHAGELAAFVIEPLVQGAAGMLVHPPGYLAGVARRCKDAEVLLIVDEVATGFGRTGTMFACEQEGVSPDFLCLAKGLTGGTLPLAATLATEEVFSAFLAARVEGKTFFHGHTYTGNPIACAAALATLDLFEAEKTLENAVRIEGWIDAELAGLRSMPAVASTRQKGTMAGIELRTYAPELFMGSRVCEAARAHGVILRPLGDVIVWMPPLSSTADEVKLLATATRCAIEETCG